MTGDAAAVMLVALALDAALGWPPALFAAIGHPVTWIGALIGRLDRWLNIDGADPTLTRLAGLVAALAVIGLAGGLAVLAMALLPGGWPGAVLAGILAWPFVAMRSLRSHVEAVAAPLAAGDLAGARAAVAMIVGRDPARLDRAGVARATLESLAENTSDGVVAPLFWGAIFGLPGIVAYKAVNTLDSMIGHHSARHRHFGWAAARIDDLANLLPARLTGLIFALLSARPRPALAVMWRDARRHRSPNAGWPEAALAGALGIRLSGPRVYADSVADEPWLNPGAPDPQPADIGRALGLYRMVMVALAVILATLGLV